MMHMQIFLPGSKSATDVTFFFIHIQNLTRLSRQCRIDLDQPVCHICFYYVMCNLYCTFFDIILQRKIPRRHRFYSVCGGFMWYVLLIYLLEEHRNNINSKCNDRRNNGSDLPDVILFVHLCFFFQSWLFNLMRSHQSVSVLPQ